MAEAILSYYGGDRFEAKSAGLFANKGQEANQLATEALKELRIPLQHRSQPITRDLMSWASVILAMTQQHKQALVMEYPNYIDKIYTLKEFVYEQTGQSRVWLDLQQAIMEREEALLEVIQLEKKANIKEIEKKEALDRLLKAEARVKTLEEDMPNYDIHDPFGSDLDEYRSVCRELENLIHQWLGKTV
jgi:protein arginine phosphatase